MSIICAYDSEGNMIHINEYTDEYKDNIYCRHGHKLLAKKGDKRLHHYCHAKNVENAPKCNGLGEWHKSSQDRIKDENLEVRIFHNNKLHIADIVNKNNIVIELQKSVIGKNTITERETFYPKYMNDMIWVIYSKYMDFSIEKQIGRYVKLKQLKGSTYYLNANKPIFLDQDKQGYIEIIHKNTGKKSKKDMIGKIWTYKEFDKYYYKDIIKDNADMRKKRHKYKFEDNNISKQEAIKLLLNK
jgi:competence CoiA-like predicted nuclease